MPRLSTSESPGGQGVSGMVPNTAENLRKLLLELYVSGAIGLDDLSDDEGARVMDTVFAAAQGREFEPLGLSFPSI